MNKGKNLPFRNCEITPNPAVLIFRDHFRNARRRLEAGGRTCVQLRPTAPAPDGIVLARTAVQHHRAGLQGQGHPAGLLPPEPAQGDPEVPDAGPGRVQRGEGGQNAGQIRPAVHIRRQEAAQVDQRNSRYRLRNQARGPPSLFTLSCARINNPLLPHSNHSYRTHTPSHHHSSWEEKKPSHQHQVS